MISDSDKKYLKEKTSEITERLLGVIMKRKIDRIPVMPLIGAASRHVLGVSYRDYAQNTDIALKCHLEAMKVVNHDALPLSLGPDLCVESTDFGGATIFPEDDTPYPDPTKWLIRDPKDFKIVRKFSWEKAKRMNSVIDGGKKLSEIVGMGGAMTIGPMGVLVRLRRPQDLIRDWILHKEELHEALDFITDILVEYVEKQLEAVSGGPSMLMIPTVCAQKDIMSREMWEELDAPYQKKIVDAAKKKGAMFITHNCGRGAYFDLLIKWLDPIGMNFAYLPYDCKTEEEMIEKYSKKVIFVGYVDTSLLALGTPSEVMAECKREIEVFKNWERGYILASACEYPTYAPLYNAIAMVRAAEAYGTYE